MMTASTKRRAQSDCAFGLFSKEEAAEMVANGVRHIHSSVLGHRDALAELTSREKDKDGKFCYSWEKVKEATKHNIESADQRHRVLQEIVASLGTKAARSLVDDVRSVLEELISNAIYHSFRLENGERKYPREAKPHLQIGERIKVACSVSEEGVYLSVEDSGGALSFDDVRESFSRCFKKGPEQISAKKKGAGLGLYMSYDCATHLRVDVWEKKRTVVSCWINRKKVQDKANFSFNYFERM